MGHAVAQLVEELRYKLKSSRFPIVSLEFLIDTILRSRLYPGVDSAANRNEYQE
jgi:hypothetical protein